VAGLDPVPAVRVAAIDIGSNSIHMVVAQVEKDGRFHVLDRVKEMVRLGKRTLNAGRLSRSAIEAGVRTLTAFRTLADRQGATRITAVATSAVREASNGGDFIREVERRVGLRVKVIPGREEARLIYLGVRHAVDLSGKPTLIVDIGGGSVEIILVEDGKPVALESLKLGVARMTERFLRTDPPSPKELADLDTHIGDRLDPILDRFAARRVKRVIGCSGTMLNLIAMAAHLRGDPPNGHLHNLAVSPADIVKVHRLIARSDRAARLQIRGLDAKRVDLIAAGACLAVHLLGRLRAKQLIACTYALREGVLLDFMARHRKGIEESERFAAPRRRSVARLARHLGETSGHGAQVARLALRLFDHLKEELRLPDAAREWLEFAALLHDIGHHIDHKNHHRHSYYLITNGELLGFRRDELEIIAQTARYHRKSAPKDSDPEQRLLSRSNRDTVRKLTALLRVADALDRSHYGVVRDIDLRRHNGSLTVGLQTGGEDAAFEIWEAERRAPLLEETLGLDLKFRVST
jgi:exopolyphosphatase/guanosine-5'-triphosphate,3'-diphosphate pyrophosphatase